MDLNTWDSKDYYMYIYSFILEIAHAGGIQLVPTPLQKPFQSSELLHINENHNIVLDA